MRGTLLSGNISSKIMGIIPAYAGNTSNVKSRVILGWDHPRVCGEHLSVPMGVGGSWGSSPRMRGTLLRGRCSTLRTGIIPAYAGNTWNLHQSKTAPRDHPRVCGEHCQFSFLCLGVLGSSPRMRGTPVSLSSIVNTRGIIPAYAGNTLAAQSSKSSTGDHPLVCGEHMVADTLERHGGGSSPRMRGTRSPHVERRNGRGIIPAYAGNTWCVSRTYEIPWDHPRVCGEHRHVNPAVCEHVGSSPRMRGTPVL